MKRFDLYVDIQPTEEFYIENVSAMTGEDLYRKSHIAHELAKRDRRIKELEMLLDLRHQESIGNG